MWLCTKSRRLIATWHCGGGSRVERANHDLQVCPPYHTSRAPYRGFSLERPRSRRLGDAHPSASAPRWFHPCPPACSRAAQTSDRS
eukprot:2952094-Prymnesium_polylepis.1